MTKIWTLLDSYASQNLMFIIKKSICHSFEYLKFHLPKTNHQSKVLLHLLILHILLMILVLPPLHCALLPVMTKIFQNPLVIKTIGYRQNKILHVSLT